MSDDAALNDAIDACYDAVVEPQTWQSALDQVAVAMNARACSIFARAAVNERLRFPASTVYREFLTEFVADGWMQRDPRVRGAMPLLAQGKQVLVERDVVTDEDRRTLPEYTYLYPKYDLPEWASVAVRAKDDYWAMSFLRGASQGAFEREDTRLLSTLSPHLPRFIKLSNHLFEQTMRTSLELLEGLSVAALQTDSRGNVVGVNANARLLVGQDIDIVDGKLRILNCNACASVQAAIDRAIKAPTASSLAAAPIVVERLYKRPLLVDVFPCVGSLHDAFGRSGAIIVLTDLMDNKPMSEARLSLIFGLTPAEARLAAQIALGLDINVACDRLRIARETARTQLKSLFAKTQTRRQAELTLVLAAATRVNGG